MQHIFFYSKHYTARRKIVFSSKTFRNWSLCVTWKKNTKTRLPASSLHHATPYNSSCIVQKLNPPPHPFSLHPNAQCVCMQLFCSSVGHFVCSIMTAAVVDGEICFLFSQGGFKWDTMYNFVSYLFCSGCKSFRYWAFRYPYGICKYLHFLDVSVLFFFFQNHFSGMPLSANLLKLESTNPKKNSRTLDAY